MTEKIKITHKNDRIYFTSGEGKEFVLISREEFDLLEKEIAFNNFMKEINKAEEEADRDGWIEEEDAWRILVIEN